MREEYVAMTKETKTEIEPVADSESSKEEALVL